MTEFLGIKIPMNPWALLPLILFATTILAYLVSTAALRILKGVVQKNGTRMDDRIYRLLERCLFPLLIVGGLLLILDVVTFPPKVLQAAQRLLVLSALLLAIFLFTKAALLILHSAANRYEGLGNIEGPVEIITKIIFIAVGGMIILDNLGISLTPIITTLGIGSLAVAIALQDTLGNFFAGLYISADRPIELGHYVRLQNGEEGYVDHIGWRSTRIKSLPNNIVVVPNSKLVQSIITNYSLPDRESAVLLQVAVDCHSDLKKVERITSEVAKETLQRVPGSVSGFEPFIRYHTFSESSIGFTVILRAREFVDNFLIKHEFIKSLQARFEKESIAFPINSVYLKAEPDGHFQEQRTTENRQKTGRSL
ncbi:MAG: mechanosensitive ion channel family protein [Deltaproteobacteria bacterium]|nr:MAG: mechanosensitive ion channel family protein [Deltaproteobacteria bacterium]